MRHHRITRRRILQSAITATGSVILRPFTTHAATANVALRLSQFLNKTRFGDLPSKTIEHAKMIVASTLASAAPGSLIDSARIVRDLAKERGGKPEATIWFDGTKLNLSEVARV